MIVIAAVSELLRLMYDFQESVTLVFANPAWAWVLLIISVTAMVQRFYIVIRYPGICVNRFENFLVALALVNLSAFYFGRSMGFIVEVNDAVAASRVLWSALLIILLFNGWRGSKRQRAAE